LSGSQQALAQDEPPKAESRKRCNFIHSGRKFASECAA
jgi:hypothetical protein